MDELMRFAGKMDGRFYALAVGINVMFACMAVSSPAVPVQLR